MSQLTNNISLYKKIDSNLVERAGIKFNEPKFKYYDNKIEKEINIEDSLEGPFKVNDYDIDWSPSEHNLKVSGSLTVVHPNELFGEAGVTSKGNIIGVAAHIYSRSSNFQKKIKIGFIQQGLNEINIPFENDFPVGSIRGSVNIKCFLYLDSINIPPTPIQANKTGMILTEEDLYNLEILVDGDGSIFPIGEFSDPKGPLWDFNRFWQDASLDSFDANNVSIRLNTAHFLFPQLKGGKTTASKALMNEIMIQSISIIINEVINIDSTDMTLADSATSDTILSAVKYWVDTFEVDTSSYITIMNSVRKKLETTLGGVDSND